MLLSFAGVQGRFGGDGGAGGGAPPATNDEGTNLYIANLSFKTREEDLRRLFDRYGEIDNLTIVCDQGTRESRYGCVRVAWDTQLSPVNSRPWSCV